MAGHGEDINDIIDNIFQMIWNRLRRLAQEEKRKEQVKEELHMSKPIQKDLTNNIKEKIQSQTPKQNLEDYKKIERSILEHELKLKSGKEPTQDEKDEYLLNNFKKDVYQSELKLTPKEQIEIRQEILETINDKEINNDVLREETLNNYQEIDNLDKQDDILNSDLAKEILKEIQNNQELQSSLSDSIKNEASYNLSVLKQNFSELSHVKNTDTNSHSKDNNTKTNNKTKSTNKQTKSKEIESEFNEIKDSTKSLNYKENELKKAEKEVEVEVEVEIER
ncbi:hypothetical protein CN895_07665 [Bacillus cereus]|uniref:hypothetical protein n=1 Tax=Bacillus cereus TaxID=1396 RepID=UPI000BFB9D71|nr:hypothetical protein [Bacillus cereus]PGK15218.1 hypothetical protein CN895_07665 [Bacillus cereus]